MDATSGLPDRTPTGAGTTAPAPPLLRSGVDVVGIDRIDRLLEEFGESFAERVFTTTERAYCEGRPDPAQHYAARWAAKEAFRKAVVADGPVVPFDAVGVVRTGDGPTLVLDAAAEAALVRTFESENESFEREKPSLERTTTSVSLAHDRPAGVAIAHVVVAGESLAEAIENGEMAEQDAAIRGTASPDGDVDGPTGTEIGATESKRQGTDDCGHGPDP